MRNSTLCETIILLIHQLLRCFCLTLPCFAALTWHGPWVQVHLSACYCTCAPVWLRHLGGIPESKNKALLSHLKFKVLFHFQYITVFFKYIGVYVRCQEEKVNKQFLMINWFSRVEITLRPWSHKVMINYCFYHFFEIQSLNYQSHENSHFL